MDKRFSAVYETVPREADGKFLPGITPGPGRPKGRVGGRAMALQTLDAMLGEERNQENLRHALQANFDNDPVKFFKQIIMPLLPTEVKLKLGEEGGARVRRATFNIQLSTLNIQFIDSSGQETMAGSLRPTSSLNAGSRPSARSPATC